MDRRISRARFDARRLLMIGGVAVAVLILAYAVLTYGFNRTLRVGAERLTVSTVEYDTFLEYIPVTGSVEPRETVYLDAVEGGQVEEIHVEAGGMVEAGQPLLRLKNTDLQLQVISTEAQLAEQINNLNTTRLAFEQNRLGHERQLIEIGYRIEDLQRQLARRRPLLSSGAVSASEVGDLEAEIAYLKRLQAAEAEAQNVDLELQSAQMEQLGGTIEHITRNLELVRQNLENLVIKAPIAGQLTTFEAKVGEAKSRGQRIGQIDQVDGFKVAANVDQFYLARVAAGQKANVELDGKSYRLTVAKTYPNVSERQFQIDLVFSDKPPRTIRRGQTLRMNLEIGAESKGLVVANGPYIEDTGGEWVFVVAPNGSAAQRRNVRIGRRNPDHVEVLSGLTKGERVITSSYERLLKFDRIELGKS